MRIVGELLSTLIISCSTGPAPADLVEGIINTESNGYIYALSGSYENKGYFRLPKTDSEASLAVAIAEESMRSEINISVGLMQINTYHMERIENLTPAVAFSPCTNILVGTSILGEIIDRVCGKTLTELCLDKSLRQYNTGRTAESEAGKEYVRKVRKNMPRSVGRIRPGRARLEKTGLNVSK